MWPSRMPAPTTFDQTRARLAVRLFNRCGAWLDQRPVFRHDTRAEDLMREAQRRCGFRDFGEDDFREALSRLLQACRSEARLNAIGRMALNSDVMRHLCNRLTLERDRRQNPAIARHQIKEPLFIVGLPRGGTTLLHTLLACDPAHRAPLTWEVFEPSPPSAVHEAARIRRAARSLSCLRWLAPTFRQVHAMGAEMPQECVGLMSPSFLSDQFDTMFNVPGYRSWFFQQELTPAYRFHRRFLQHLQQRRPAARWILKAPAHMFGLSALLQIYPDALFVQTHRAPLEAISSVSSLIAILRRVFSDEVDLRQIGTEALEYWSSTMQSFMKARERSLGGRICDVQYRDLRRDPIGAVRRVYAHFGWPLCVTTEQRMRQMLAQQPREQHGLHRYEPAQFGLHRAPEAARFNSYCRRFGLPLPLASENAERAA